MADERILHVALTAAETAAKFLREFYGVASVRQKSSTNLVTEADLAAERAIADVILKSFPDHRILGEEGEATGGDNKHSLWVVDPLDGTNNYAHGIPQFAVSIAYAFDGEVQVGVILDPMRDEKFTAMRGQGARLNGNLIGVSDAQTIADSIIATGFYYDRGEVMHRTLDAIRDLFEADLRGIRRLGAAALDLAWVACGRLEGFFEYQLSPWDYAAGSLIVSEAGGRCTDRDGDALTLESANTIASNSKIHEQLADIVRYSKKEDPKNS